ncbi:MAG: hypothetical protein WCP92_07205 [bacterium]
MAGCSQNTATNPTPPTNPIPVTDATVNTSSVAVTTQSNGIDSDNDGLPDNAERLL